MYIKSVVQPDAYLKLEMQSQGVVVGSNNRRHEEVGV